MPSIRSALGLPYERRQSVLSKALRAFYLCTQVLEEETRHTAVDAGHRSVNYQVVLLEVAKSAPIMLKFEN